MKSAKEILETMGFNKNSLESTQMALIRYLVKDSVKNTISKDDNLAKNCSKSEVTVRKDQQLSFPDTLLNTGNKKKSKAS